MKKLYRLRQDKMLFGLCGGIARMINVDASLLRILLVVVTILTGFPILIYLLAALVVPKEPPIYSDYGPHGYGSGYGQGGYGSNGYGQNFNQGYGTGGQFGSQPSYGGPYKNPPQPQGPWSSPNPGAAPTGGSQFDSMIDDLEKKALRREIDELKAKLAKYEKGDQ